MKEQWRHQLQRIMADYRRPAPEVSWAVLENALARNRRARTVLLWKRMAAAAVILLLAGAGYWTVIGRDADVHDMSAGTDEVLDHPLQREHIMTERLLPLAAMKTDVDTVMTVMTVLANEVEGQERADRDTIVQNDVDDERSATVQMISSQPEGGLHSVSMRKSAHSVSRLTAKVYLSNGLAGGDGASASSLNYIGAGYDPGIRNLYGDDIVYQGDEVTKSQGKIRHRRPIRFGLSLRYGINDRLSLESGLSYTLLKSDITTVLGNLNLETEQRLAYIGVPVTVSYLLWGSRYVNLYVMGGGMAEKMVRGRRETGQVTESVKIRPLQLSLNCALGAEYRLNNLISVYAEPGLGYYFDNGSSVPTLYQEKPLNLNLNFGLRLNIK